MSTARNAVTVLVVTYNSAAVVEGCLASLPAALAGVEHQVVIVDNASTDGTVNRIADRLPSATVVQTGRNAGYAAAINAGLDHVEPGGDVLVLNPDVRLSPGSVARLRGALRASGAGLAVPRIVDGQGAPQFSLRRDPTITRALGEAVLGGRRAGRHPRLGEMVTDESAYRSPGWADWATGAVMLVSGECRAAVGPWDESFFLYSEETDFCQRARRAGFGVRYVPGVQVTHLGGELEQSPYLRGILVRSKVRLFSRRRSRPAALAYRAVLAANELSRAIGGSAPHRAGLAAAVARPGGSPAGDRRTGFVVFSAQDYWYHNRAHSDVQIARGLSRSRTVLLVNSIGMRTPLPGRSTQVVRRLLRKLRSIARSVKQPEPAFPGLHVMSPFILPFYGNPRLRALNAALVRWQVRSVLRRLGVYRPHALVTIPTAWDVVSRMDIASLVVNRSDKYSAFGEIDNDAVAGMERALLARAEAALYVNHGLLDEERPLVGEGRSVFLGHGVDFEHFASATRNDPPADLAAIPGPRIGFFGGIDDYVIDFELLERLAEEIPDASLVLIGAATCDMTPLLAHPNAHWLGLREYGQIPAYGAGFDVAIMPWLQNEWIKNCNPIKTKEYLALGVPVVSSYYPESVHVEDVIAVARDHDDFVRLVREALAGKGVSTADERRDRVRGDSWRARSDVVLDLAETKGGR